LQTDQLLCIHPRQVDTGGGRTNVDPQVAAIGPAQLRKCLRERGEEGLRLRIVLVVPGPHANPTHPVCLLRPPRYWPRRRAC
jgi:hypothetical protein